MAGLHRYYPQYLSTGMLFAHFMNQVNPERRFFTPSSKAEVGAAEWVNCSTYHDDGGPGQKKNYPDT